MAGQGLLGSIIGGLLGGKKEEEEKLRFGEGFVSSQGEDKQGETKQFVNGAINRQLESQGAAKNTDVQLKTEQQATSNASQNNRSKGSGLWMQAVSLLNSGKQQNSTPQFGGKLSQNMVQPTQTSYQPNSFVSKYYIS